MCPNCALIKTFMFLKEYSVLKWIVTFLSIICSYLWIEWGINYIKRKRANIPGPFCWPVFGYYFKLSKNVHESLYELSKKFGNIYEVHVGCKRFVVLHDLTFYRRVFTVHSEAISGKPILCNTTKYIADAAHRDEGKRWTKRRNTGIMCLKMFGERSIGLEDSIIGNETENGLIQLNKLGQGQVFSLRKFISQIHVIIMYRITFDRCYIQDDIDDLLKICETIADYTKYTGVMVNACDMMPWLLPFVKKGIKKFETANNTIKTICQKQIKIHIDSFDESRKPIDSMDYMIQCANKMDANLKKKLNLTDDLLFAVTEDFLRAGVEAPTLLNWWTIVYMINYPEIQKKMKHELAQFDENEVDIINYNQKLEIPYTCAVVYEVARHASPNPIIKRRAMKEFCIDNKYTIKEGTFVVGNLYGISHDEKYWKDPMTFRPERFINSEGAFDDKITENFIPFGIGARRCIAEGIGTKYSIVITANLFRKHGFFEAPGEKINLDCTYGMSLTPKYEMATYKRC